MLQFLYISDNVFKKDIKRQVGMKNKLALWNDVCWDFCSFFQDASELLLLLLLKLQINLNENIHIHTNILCSQEDNRGGQRKT